MPQKQQQHKQRGRSQQQRDTTCNDDEKTTTQFNDIHPAHQPESKSSHTTSTCDKTVPQIRQQQ